MAKQRILIVGNGGAAARELEARLRRLGYEVAAMAASGGEAIDIAAQAAPDLVLMGMELRGGLDGRATAAALRRHRPVPVLFLVEEADETERDPVGPADPDTCVVMPCSDRELRTTIELALCRHDAARVAHELESFFAVSLDMFCFLDFSGYFKRLNPAWERTLGFTRQELMSRPFIEFVHPDDRERTLRQNAQVRGGGQAVSFENRYLCKDGSYRWLLWNSAPVSAERVIYAVARDITARKQAEDERAQMVRELESSLAEVKTLQAILPICSYCRKIRDDENYWQTVETYISRHTTTRFSHGICPQCMATEVEPCLEQLGHEAASPDD